MTLFAKSVQGLSSPRAPNPGHYRQVQASGHAPLYSQLQYSKKGWLGLSLLSLTNENRERILKSTDVPQVDQVPQRKQAQQADNRQNTQGHRQPVRFIMLGWHRLIVQIRLVTLVDGIDHQRSR